MKILGVDPGVHGGLAIIVIDDGAEAALIAIVPMQMLAKVRRP